MSPDSTTTESLTVSKIPQLADDATNWVTYSTRLSNYVASKPGSKKHLDGRAHKPLTLKVVRDTNGKLQVVLDDGTTVATQADIDNREKLIDEWDTREAAVKQIIFSSISDRRLMDIQELDTAHEMWTRLCQIHQDKPDLSAVAKRTQLNNMRCAEGEDIHAHLSAMQKLRLELAGMKHPVNETDYMSMLQQSMPKSYHNFMSAILATSRVTKTKITPDELITHLTAEYDIREALKNKPNAMAKSGGSALVVTSEGQKRKSNKGSSQKKGDKARTVCENCNKPNHRREDCWRKGGGKEGQGPWQRNKEKEKEKEPSSMGKPTPSASVASHNYAFSASDSSYVVSKAELTDYKRGAIIDCGATAHFTPLRDDLIDFRTVNGITIKAADGRSFAALGVGDLPIELPNGSSRTSAVLKNVLYAPNLMSTLISVSRLDKAGFSTMVKNGTCTLISPKPERKVIAQIPFSNGLYRISGLTTSDALESSLYTHTANIYMSMNELHQKFAHISHDALRDMVKSGAVEGIKADLDSPQSFCETCVKAKITRVPFPKESKTRAKTYGERIHSDLWGPAPVDSLGHKRYCITFTDEASDETKLYFIQHKSETFNRYKQYEKWIKVHRKADGIKNLRTDRGGEYLSDSFIGHLNENATHHELTVHDSPQQDGKAERLNRTMVEGSRALLIGSGLPKHLWAEAFNHFVWIRNRVPHRALQGRSPYEFVHGSKPNLGGIQAFGATVWVKDLEANKLESHAKVGRFVGYDEESKGYRIYYPEKRWVGIERNVRFNPDEILISDGDVGSEGEWHLPATDPTITHDKSHTPDPIKETENHDNEVEQSSEIEIPETQTNPDDEVDGPDLTRPPDGLDPPVPNHGRGMRHRPQAGYYNRLNEGQRPENTSIALLGDNLNFGDDELHAFMVGLFVSDSEIALPALSDTPTWKEALSSPLHGEWIKARDVEMAMIDKFKTYTVVPRPQNVNVIPSHFVPRIKRNAEGGIDKLKVRLVAGGNRQIYGLDFSDTFTWICRLDTHRVIFAIAAQEDWEIEMIDFKSAYLNAKPDQVIYMRLPPGREEPGKVARLDKCLYGTKQAGKGWYEDLRETMLKKLGFTLCNADKAVFIKHEGDEHLVVGVSTDDSSVAGTPKMVKWFKTEIAKHYEITDLGAMNFLLGFRVKRDRAACTISINMKTFAESIMERYEIDKKPTYLPMHPGTVLSSNQSPSNDEEREYMKDIPYRSLLGALWYAATVCSPEIVFPLSLCARYAENPGAAHYKSLCQIAQYLYTNRDLWLTFGGHSGGLAGYTDADWATQVHRHSTSGYSFHIGSGAITWSSKKQSIIALSSCESEYIGQSQAARENIWLRNLISEISPKPIKNPTPLHSDNQGAIALAKSGSYHARTKHIDIRYHFIREAVTNRQLFLKYLPTEDMIADIFTKALPRRQFEKLRTLLGVRTA